ncbi:hypothetical protein Sm713_25950 [Streptomyces sp. TS71-3]|nr:hypothetical protein Sm713_25950 [Streptomyces sp. TS71-3]
MENPAPPACPDNRLPANRSGRGSELLRQLFRDFPAPRPGRGRSPTVQGTHFALKGRGAVSMCGSAAWARATTHRPAARTRQNQPLQTGDNPTLSSWLSRSPPRP